MSTITEQNVYEPGIYQIELTDPIQGGEDGISNLQAKQLANRTNFLKNLLEIAHETDGSHKVADLLASLNLAIGDAQVAHDANIDESKINLYFRGASRPGELGAYNTSRELAEDVIRLTDMNSLGDLLLSQSSMEILRDMTRQFYSSSGVLFAGGTSYTGHTPVTSGSDGGGIFTQDTATVDMAGKLQLVGDMVFNVDGYALKLNTPATVSFPDAPDTYVDPQRKDLMYMTTVHANLTQGDLFYPGGDKGLSGSVWSDMTEEEKKLAAVDIHNNLYTGANYNVYQVQYELKTAEGVETLTSLGYVKTLRDTKLYYKEDTLAIEILTIPRRNKGAYHTTYNPKGTGAFYGDNLADIEDEDTHVIPDVTQYDITATSTSVNSFSISGDHVSEFPAGFEVTISGTTDNDGNHMVVSATYDSGTTSTEIVVDTDMTENTGNVGKLESALWFYINYCFTHVAEGLGSNLSGSVASGLCYYEESDTVIPQGFHDHFMNTDVIDKRVYLETATPEADPNLTLNTPALAGVPLSVYELEVFEFTISNYNGALDYTVNALFEGTSDSAGTIAESEGVVTWSVPAIDTDRTVRVSIYAEDGSGNFSETGAYIVYISDLAITGDDSIAVTDSDWAGTSNLTISSGLTADTDGAVAYSAAFDQATGDSDWGKIQVAVERDLYEWTIDGTSTVSSLVLNGDHAVNAEDVFVVKYAGTDVVGIITLDISSVSWNGSNQNILTLGTALPEVPEKIWDYDVDVFFSLGTETEALVSQTALSLNSSATSTTQVVGSSATTNLWVTGGYNDKIGITVNGANYEVTIYSVSVVGDEYTIQIPEQPAAPTAAWKPTTYKQCTTRASALYNSVSDTIDVTYTEFVCYDSNIRQVKFQCDIANAGNGIDALTADLWKEV